MTPKLPPTLYSCIRYAMTGCSKAPWGLSVLRWGMRIFTHTTISPSLSPRQRPDRYAFRAGRNLPDKEFRYLRTVIVTAAVHRGFGSKLAPLPLTFRHWAGVSPYTSFSTLQRPVFLLNSRLRRFTATHVLGGHSFSRSYGANVPSS